MLKCFTFALVMLRKLILLSVTTLSTFSSFAEERVLTLFNWQFYLSENVIERWEKETGAKLEQVYFDNDTVRDRTLNQEQLGAIDIAVLDEVSSRNFSAQGKLDNLLQSNAITNIDLISNRWTQQCGTHTVPYFWGTLGVVYRADVFDSPPDSWNDIMFPSQEHSGYVGMMADYTDMLMPYMFLNQLDITTTKQEHLEDAYEALRLQIPHVLTYEYPITYLEQTPEQASKLHLAMAYSGDQKTMNSLTPDFTWKFVTPKEGTVLWVDCLALLKDSKNKDLAHHFINFVNQPEIAALNSIDTGNPSTNIAAQNLVKDSTTTLAQQTPEEDILDRSYFYSEMSGISMTLRSRISNSILKQHRQLSSQ